MMNRRMMAEMFMNSDDYAKTLEFAFEKVFIGNKEPLVAVFSKIMNVLESILDKGYLSFHTFKEVDAVKSLFDGDHIIISNDTEEITVLNKEDDSFDRFYLGDFISWLVSKLSADPLFKSEMSGHYDYAGMMKVLETLSRVDGDTGVRYSSAVNAITYGTHLYIVDEEQGRLRLLKLKKKPSSPMDRPTELMELSSPNVFQDRRHGWVYANDIVGDGRRIDMETDEIHPVYGEIIGLTNESELIVRRNNNLLLCNHKNDILMRIGNINNVLLNPHETEGVSWMSIVNGKFLFSWHYKNRLTEAHSLKADFVWNYFLEHAYDFGEDIKNKLSSIIWTHKIFRTPTPFTAPVIKDHIRIIEQGIREGLVQKAELYSDMLQPILTENNTSKDLTEDLFCIYDINESDFKKHKYETDYNSENRGNRTDIIRSNKKHELSDDYMDEYEDDSDIDVLSMISDLETMIDAKIKEHEEEEERERKREEARDKKSKSAKSSKKRSGAKRKKKPEKKEEPDADMLHFEGIENDMNKGIAEGVEWLEDDMTGLFEDIPF